MTKRALGVLCGVFLVVTVTHPFVEAWAAAGDESEPLAGASCTGSRDGVRAALQQAGAAQGASPHEKLESLFDMGTLPARSDLTGWFAGRWVRADTPLVVRPALLIGALASPVPDGGPLFEATLHAMPTFSMERGHGPGHFDAPSEEVLTESWKSFQTEIGRRQFEVRLSTGDRAAVAEAHGGKLRLAIRRSGTYLVVQSTMQNVLVGYGYFFQRLSPPASAREQTAATTRWLPYVSLE